MCVIYLGIAAYEAKMANKQLQCMQCCNALGSRNHHTNSKFMALKDRVGLFKPTKNVENVCEETEKCFNRMLETTGGNLPCFPGRNSIKYYSFITIHANITVVHFPIWYLKKKIIRFILTQSRNKSLVIAVYHTTANIKLVVGYYDDVKYTVFRLAFSPMQNNLDTFFS